MAKTEQQTTYLIKVNHPRTNRLYSEAKDDEQREKESGTTYSAISIIFIIILLNIQS